MHRLPYPGLRAFTRDESDLFFGREGCVDVMVDRLAATRFLAVLGASGSGKSSLVRTGLLDALDLGLHPWAGSRWAVADLYPGSQPVRNLAAALLATKGSVPAAIDVELLTTFLGHGPRSVVEWASGGHLPTDTNLLILVDQFEELFRYGDYAQREEAEAFVALLLESAADAGVAIHVIITMRSEYLGACALIPGLAERINTGLYLTPRMGREECRQAIEGPAGVMGFTVEPALVNRILNDLASFAPWEATQEADQLERLARRADQLPLMQHVLNRLWLRTSQDAGDAAVELRLRDYEGIGGLSGALDAHGAEVMAAIGAHRAPYIEDVFRALVSGTSVAQAVRRPCAVGELVELSDARREDVIAVVEAFRAPDCGFIRTSERALAKDDVIVDISHESLIRQWTPLANWLEKETTASAKWQLLVSAAERHANGEGSLLTGLDLANFRAWWEDERPRASWAARHGGQFDRAQAFLRDSQQAADAQMAATRDRDLRERTRLRQQRAGLAVALATTVGLAVFAGVEWRNANQMTASALAARDDAEKQRSETEKQTIAAMESGKKANSALEEANRQKLEAERQQQEAERQRKAAEGARDNATAATDRAQRAEMEAAQNAQMAQEFKVFFENVPGALKEAAQAYLSQFDSKTINAVLSEMRRTGFKRNPALSTDEVGIAIYGYDPVAYFTDKRPVAASAKDGHYAIWNGGIWLFASAEHRAMFLASPERYAPQYGGFCAFCVASGTEHKYPADPTNWVVYEGQLFLHETKAYRDDWLKDPPRFIKQANQTWPKMAAAPPGKRVPNIAASNQLKAAIAPVEDLVAKAKSLDQQEKWTEAAQLLDNALTIDPNHVEALRLADWIYHERLFRYDRAFALNARRVELGSGQSDYVEKHLTTGRFRECATLAQARYDEVTDKGVKLVMRAIRFACLWVSTGDSLKGRVSSYDVVTAANVLRKEMEGLQKVGWTFDGTKHFLKTNASFDKTADWVRLFEALEVGDQPSALSALAALDGSPVPRPQ